MNKNKELEQAMVEAIASLDDAQVTSCANQMIEEGYAPLEIERFLNQGLKKVGELFENGEYFIADLMYSGMLYRSVLDIFSPGTQFHTSPTKEKILIGVVEKDIHDIGKDIVVGLLASDGFEVIDLGTDVSPQIFVDAIQKHQPSIVLMSGMMLFARESMRKTIEAIEQAGLRKQVHIMLGGGCVDESILEHVHADAVTFEPIDTVKYCNEYVNRRNS